MNNYFKKSLGRRVIIINLIFIVLLLAGMVSLRFYHMKITKAQDEQISSYTEKLNQVTTMKENLNSVMFDARGFFAFKSDAFLQQIKKKQLKIQNDMAAFENKYNKPKDRALMTELKSFTDEYFNTLLPRAIDYSRNDQINEVIKMSQQDGGTQKVNDVLSVLSSYEDSIQRDITKTYETKERKIYISQIIYFSFITIMVLVFAGLIRLMIKQVGAPLRDLAHVSSKITRGEIVSSIPYTERLDEIGVLSNSFERMIKSLQDNEQELIAQNEELAAQQDELSAQQMNLQDALTRTEENEKMLLMLNAFINSLSNTLDKKQLLLSIVSNMVKITRSTKGLIWLVNEDGLATIGLSESEQNQFLTNFPNASMLVRLKECKNPQQIVRKTNEQEKGYVKEAFISGDLYIPVVSGEEVLAVIVLTRNGTQYSEKELDEYDNLAKQISLSLEKIKLYEVSEEQRKTTQNVLNSIQEGVQLINSEGNIIQANQKFCEIMDCERPEQLINKHYDEWTETVKQRVDSADHLITFIKNAAQEQDNVELSFIFELKTDKKKIIQIYAERLVRRQKKIGTIFVYRDITKQYEVDRMKSEFVTTVSHELRTPLSSVLGFTELMLTRQLKPERQKKYLTTIHQEAYRLTSLINDFLDVQKMESGSQIYEKKYHSIIPIIESVIDLQKVNTAGHQFDVQINTDRLTVLGDKDKLSQIFMNLISNAIKYSPDGGKITIQVRNDENYLIIDVIDEGLGIPKEALANLFTKFYRVDNSDRRKIGGTGLGLAIVKEIIKAHHGQISVTSKLGEGSTFTIEFPIIEDVYVNADVTSTQNQNVDIYIIEDDRNLAVLLTEELMEHGFHIAHFSNGEKAIEALADSIPQAIVLDVMLEGKMDGWEVIQSLKKNPVTENIPIFISSALDEKQKGLTHGAAGYLTKPYHPSQLTSHILQILLNKEKQGHILIPLGSSELNSSF